MHIPGTGSIRRTLYLGMALTLAVGLGVFLFFSFYTTGQVRSILRRDLGGLATLAATSLEREHQTLNKHLADMARSKALQVILQLDMPPQAALFLEANAQRGPFTRLWVLGLDHTAYSVFPADAGPPPDFPRDVDSIFLAREGVLKLVLRTPITVGGRTRGVLVAEAPFPDQGLIEGFSRPGDTGMALWLDNQPLARSGWLGAVGYTRQGSPADRDTLSLHWGDETHEFLTHSLPVSLATPSTLRLEMVRSLAHAEQPFFHLLAAFFAGWVLILVSFLVFARYVNTRLVVPILNLSHLAGTIAVHGELPDEMQGWRDAPKDNEISVLHRAFARTVTSLHQALVKAEAADRAKGDFLATVSHELRTPLTSILGFAKIVRRRVVERLAPALTDSSDPKVLAAAEQVEENMDIILAEAGHLTELIDDVLDLTRMEAGTLDWTMEELDVLPLVEEAVAGFQESLRAKGLTCEIRVEPGLPRIPGDRARLVQALRNLLSNAVKFTATGAVAVHATRDGDGVRLSVADTGPGIPGEERERIFDVFHQTGDTLTDKPKGTGLGLAVTRLIVHRHGGRIWVDSRPGQGSAFSMLLPATGRKSTA